MVTKKFVSIHAAASGQARGWMEGWSNEWRVGWSDERQRLRGKGGFIVGFIVGVDGPLFTS